MISGMTLLPSTNPTVGPLAYTNFIVEEPLRLALWPSTLSARRYNDPTGILSGCAARVAWASVVAV
jgi:hypothetical protein